MQGREKGGGKSCGSPKGTPEGEGDVEAWKAQEIVLTCVDWSSPHANVYDSNFSFDLFLGSVHCFASVCLPTGKGVKTLG